MTEKMNERDWILISAYLDARLSPAETSRVETRLKVDNLFKQSLDEITYTKRLLAALPQKRAPRNFTLAPDKVRKPLRGLWLQPALSFVSIAAAVMLAVVFTFNTLGGSVARQSASPQAEMFAAESAAVQETAPVIINWNPVLGMGGGAADSVAKEVYTGGDGIGGAGGPGFPITAPGVGGGPPAGGIDPLLPPEVSSESPGLVEPAPAAAAEPAPEALPQPAPQTQEEEPAADTDLSTLILGLPEGDEAGTVIESAPLRTEPPAAPPRGLPAATMLMSIAGIIAVLAGIGALILRKLTHA